MPACGFELDRFTAEDKRLEVSGRWVGVRGRRFVRPSLTAFIDGHSTRALADLEHKPWAAEEGDEWVAAFPWRGELDQIEEFELAVAPDLSVRLPPPAESIEEVVLPVVVPQDHARPARSERAPDPWGKRAPDPPRGEPQELREQADAVRHNALAVRDRALAELDAAIAMRDALRAELDQAVSDRDSVRASRQRAIAERDRLELELGRTRAELRMARSDLELARKPVRPGPPPPEPRPLAPAAPLAPLPPRRAHLHRSQAWTVRAFAIVLIIAVLVALIIVLTSGPASVAP